MSEVLSEAVLKDIEETIKGITDPNEIWNQCCCLKLIESHCILQRRVEELSGALNSLRNNVAGALSIEGQELCNLLGNTNVNCIQRNIEQADELLKAPHEARG